MWILTRTQALAPLTFVLAVAVHTPLPANGSEPGKSGDDTYAVDEVRPPWDPEEHQLAFEIVREVQRIAAQQTLWPGFEPQGIPLAIHTGSHTWLFHHPAPPEGFSPVDDMEPSVYFFPDRHPTVVANTVVEIGGTDTATLLAEASSGQPGPAELAPVALHEVFHVYQREAYPDWVANEAELFVYPVDDPDLLGLRRLESSSLRRALSSPDHASSACWTRRALEFREERFGQIPPGSITYEQMTELVEGTAHYVEYLAAGKTRVEIPEEEFPATAVRHRAYASGAALAVLLDRLQPAWQTDLDSNAEPVPLDRVLQEAVAPYPDHDGQCRLADEETTRIRHAARKDVAALIESRRERREEFDKRPGWRIVIEAVPETASDAQPLMLQGFDPLNVEQVDGGILHTRMLLLANDAGRLELVRRSARIEALTEAAGAHPLFSGVGRITLVGMPEPLVKQHGQEVAITTPDLELTFDAAQVSTENNEIRIVISP